MHLFLILVIFLNFIKLILYKLFIMKKSCKLNILAFIISIKVQVRSFVVSQLLRTAISKILPIFKITHLIYQQFATSLNPPKPLPIFKNTCKLKTRHCRLLLNDSFFRKIFFETAAFSTFVLSKFLFL